MTTKISIPAPCGFINSNHRYNKFEKADLIRAWRLAGKVAARGTSPFAPPVRIVAHIWKPKGGRYDPNNLADTTKAIVDGLVDAGLLVDDDHTRVKGPDHRHGGIGPARIELTITELGDGGFE